MPDLSHTLQGHDLGFLRMVAEAWGIELNAPDTHTAQTVLLARLRDPSLVDDVTANMPAEARRALQDLLDHEGRMTWALFSRRYGDVRVMGPSKRDREHPERNPISTAEVLWYRALIGKAFLDAPPASHGEAAAREAQEYAYIPDDIVTFLGYSPPKDESPIGRPASPKEAAFPILASDTILDDICTLLAALRLRMNPEELEPTLFSTPRTILQALLRAAGFLNDRNFPYTEVVRAHLSTGRGEALAGLVQAWMASNSFNELRLLPGFIFEGDWANDPAQTRAFILEQIGRLPAQTWWSITAFINALHKNHPDFQRPAGDYDSWFIRKEGTESYLRGIESWEEVEGNLVRFLLTGPLHSLGLVDLAAPEPGIPPTAFRFSSWGPGLWHGEAPKNMHSEQEPLKVSQDAKILASAHTSRAARYLVARFCEWGGRSEKGYHYRLTPASLQRAAQKGQDLRLQHLMAVLRRYSAGQLPPLLLQALERWESSGTQAQVTNVTLLKVASPEILDSLRQGRAKRYLGEQLSPTTILVKAGNAEALRTILANMGYLVDLAQDPRDEGV